MSCVRLRSCNLDDDSLLATSDLCHPRYRGCLRCLEFRSTQLFDLDTLDGSCLFLAVDKPLGFLRVGVDACKPFSALIGYGDEQIMVFPRPVALEFY